MPPPPPPWIRPGWDTIKLPALLYTFDSFLFDNFRKILFFFEKFSEEKDSCVQSHIVGGGINLFCPLCEEGPLKNPSPLPNWKTKGADFFHRALVQDWLYVDACRQKEFLRFYFSFPVFQSMWPFLAV